jgi:hypothetical protein
MKPNTIASRRFIGYKYSIRLALIVISHSFTFSSRVFSLPLHLFTMEEKRGLKRSRSSGSDSSSSSSDTSTPLPSLSEPLPPPLSPSNVSSRKSLSPMCEHGRPSEISVVDLSSDEEGDALPDTSWDDEFTRNLFGDLNCGVLGPPDDDNVTILSDSDEEEEVREITADAKATPSSVVNSLAPFVSAVDATDAPTEVQDDNSDDGDKTSSP